MAESSGLDKEVVEELLVAKCHFLEWSTLTNVNELWQIPRSFKINMITKTTNSRGIICGRGSDRNFPPRTTLVFRNLHCGLVLVKSEICLLRNRILR